MRLVKLTLSYDGTAYSGWQVQSGRRTLQGTLEATLEKIVGHPVRITGSGRTDAGVHALAQAAVFTTESRLSAEVLRKAINAELPEDISVAEVCDAPAGFHPTRDALRKCYRYVLNDGPVRDVFARRYCWHCYTRLDVGAMQRAAEALVGTHDFCSFESAGAERDSTVRTIYALRLTRDPPPASDRIVIEIEADGFLYNMVRAIVGTLVEVGRGAHGESWPGEALVARNRSAAGPTAPPQGLSLVKVEYA